MDRLLRRLPMGFRVSGGAVLLVIWLMLVPSVIGQIASLTAKRVATANADSQFYELLLSASLHQGNSRTFLERYILSSGRIGFAQVDLSPAQKELELCKQAIQDVQLLNLGAEEQQQLTDILDYLAKYETLLSDVNMTITEGASINDLSLIQLQADSHADYINNSIQSILVEHARRANDQIEADLKQDQIRLFRWIGIGVGLVLFAIAISIWVVWGFKRQIDELHAGTENIRQGKYDQTIPVMGEDELSQLARNLNLVSAHISLSQETQKKKIEANLLDIKNREFQLRTVAELARDAAFTQDIDLFLQHSISLISERFNLYYVAVFLLDDKQRYAVLKAGTGPVGRELVNRGYRLKIGELGLVGSVSASGQVRITNDVETDFAFVKNPLLLETCSEAALPMNVGRDVIGVLDVHSTAVGVFTDEKVTILQTLADQMSVAIQNARLVRNLQDSIDEARTLYQRYTQETWSKEKGRTRSSGYVFDLIDVLPLEKEQLKLGSLPKEVMLRLREGHAVSYEDREKVSVGYKETENVRSLLLVPLKLYNEMIGVIGLEGDTPTYSWEPQEIEVIEAVTNQITLALDNARLLDETQLRSNQLRFLQEVTAVAASHTDLVELLDTVAQKLRAGFNLTHCGMMMVSSDSKTAQIIASASSDPFIPGAKVIGTQWTVEDSSVIRSIRERHQAALIMDAQNWKHWRKDNPAYETASEKQADTLDSLFRSREVDSVAIAPLVSRGEMVGLIVLESVDERLKFFHNELQLLDQISLTISSAIDVARSFEQTAQRAERERMVGNITRRIRESLDLQTILKTAAQEVRLALDVPEVTVRLTPERLTLEGETPLRSEGTRLDGSTEHPKPVPPNGNSGDRG